ncbi:hypothetical protein T484DRAFT_1886420, partial [Baffinella frigidus]
MGAVNSSQEEGQAPPERRIPPFNPAAYPGTLHATYQNPSELNVAATPPHSSGAALPNSPPASPASQPYNHTGATPMSPPLFSMPRPAMASPSPEAPRGAVYGAAYPPEMASIVLQIEQQGQIRNLGPGVRGGTSSRDVLAAQQMHGSTDATAHAGAGAPRDAGGAGEAKGGAAGEARASQD